LFGLIAGRDHRQRSWAALHVGGRPADRLSDYVAAYNHFHPAVLLPTRGGIVRGNRIRFTETLRLNVGRGDAVRSQVIAHRVGTAFRQLLIIVVRADAVGVALHGKVDRRIGQQNARNFGQLFLGVGFERRLVEVEKHVGQAHDQAARCVASGENEIELIP